MLKKNKKTLILTSIITVLPALIGIILWSKLPNTMATHFGANSEADGFGNKWFAVIGLPFALLALQWLCAIVTAKDPRKQNISNKLYILVLWIIPCVSIFTAALIYPYNLGIKMDIDLFARIFIGLLFIIIGNYLPKIRQNYTIGIKLPWTLANEENWNKTHRFAGVIYIITGIAVLLTIFMGKLNNLGVMFVVAIIAAIMPCIYSFMLYIRKK